MMADDNTFADSIRRIRAGDERAAAELVRLDEPATRLGSCMRLGDPWLWRVLDSMNLYRSALSGFSRRAAGQYDLQRPEHLVWLLVTIARSKVAFRARRQRAQRREVAPDARELAGTGPSPSRVTSGRERLAELRRRLSAVLRRLADRLAAGRERAEVAAELGGTQQARRKQTDSTPDRIVGGECLGRGEDA